MPDIAELRTKFTADDREFQAVYERVRTSLSVFSRSEGFRGNHFAGAVDQARGALETVKALSAEYKHFESTVASITSAVLKEANAFQLLRSAVNGVNSSVAASSFASPKLSPGDSAKGSSDWSANHGSRAIPSSANGHVRTAKQAEARAFESASSIEIAALRKVASAAQEASRQEIQSARAAAAAEIQSASEISRASTLAGRERDKKSDSSEKRSLLKSGVEDLEKIGEASERIEKAQKGLDVFIDGFRRIKKSGKEASETVRGTEGAVSKLSDISKIAGGGLEGLAGGSESLAGAEGSAAVGAEGLSGALAAVGNPEILAAIAAVAATVAGVYLAIKTNFAGVRDTLKQTLDFVSKAWQDVWAKTAYIAKEVWSTIGGTVTLFIKTMVGNFVTQIKVGVAMFQWFVDRIADGVMTFKVLFGDGMKGLSDLAKIGAGQVQATIYDMVARVLEYINGMVAAINRLISFTGAKINDLSGYLAAAKELKQQGLEDAEIATQDLNQRSIVDYMKKIAIETKAGENAPPIFQSHSNWLASFDKPDKKHNHEKALQMLSTTPVLLSGGGGASQGGAAGNKEYQKTQDNYPQEEYERLKALDLASGKWLDSKGVQKLIDMGNALHVSLKGLRMEDLNPDGDAAGTAYDILKGHYDNHKPQQVFKTLQEQLWTDVAKSAQEHAKTTDAEHKQMLDDLERERRKAAIANLPEADYADRIAMDRFGKMAKDVSDPANQDFVTKMAAYAKAEDDAKALAEQMKQQAENGSSWWENLGKAIKDYIKRMEDYDKVLSEAKDAAARARARGTVSDKDEFVRTRMDDYKQREDAIKDPQKLKDLSDAYAQQYDDEHAADKRTEQANNYKSAIGSLTQELHQYTMSSREAYEADLNLEVIQGKLKSEDARSLAFWHDQVERAKAWSDQVKDIAQKVSGVATNILDKLFTEGTRHFQRNVTLALSSMTRSVASEWVSKQVSGGIEKLFGVGGHDVALSANTTALYQVAYALVNFAAGFAGGGIGAPSVGIPFAGGGGGFSLPLSIFGHAAASSGVGVGYGEYTAADIQGGLARPQSGHTFNMHITTPIDDAAARRLQRATAREMDKHAARFA